MLAFFAKKYLQRSGVDYNQTYSLGARSSKIWVLFKLAALYNVFPKRLVVNFTFFNAMMELYFHTEQPEMFQKSTVERPLLYCKLKCSMFGLNNLVLARVWHRVI